MIQVTKCATLRHHLSIAVVGPPAWDRFCDRCSHATVQPEKYWGCVWPVPV